MTTVVAAASRRAEVLSAGANATAAMVCASERFPWMIGLTAFSGSDGAIVPATESEAYGMRWWIA